jgi:hypothetical protein
VEDQIRSAEDGDARLGEPPRAPGQVRVRDDGDARYRTANGGETISVVRAALVDAARRMA